MKKELVEEGGEVMKNLKDMNKGELITLSKERGLSYSNKRKEDLLKALRLSYIPKKSVSKIPQTGGFIGDNTNKRVGELEGKMDKMFDMLSKLTQKSEPEVVNNVPILQDVLYVKPDDSEVEEFIDEPDDESVTQGEASEDMILSEYLNMRSVTLNELEMLVQNYKTTNPEARNRVSTIEEIEAKIQVGEDAAKEIVASGKTQAMIIDLHVSDALQKNYGWVVKDIKMNGEHYLIAA